MIAVIIATLLLLRLATCDAVAAVESLEEEASSVPNKNKSPEQKLITDFFSPKQDKAEEQPVVEESTDATQELLVEKAAPSGPTTKEEGFIEIIEIVMSGNLAYMVAINLWLREALWNYVQAYVYAAIYHPNQIRIEQAKAQVLMNHFGISFEVLNRRFCKDWAKIWYNLDMYRMIKEHGDITDPNVAAMYKETLFKRIGVTDPSVDLVGFRDSLVAHFTRRNRARAPTAPNEQPKTTSTLLCAFGVCLLMACAIAAVAVGFVVRCHPAAVVNDVVEPAIVIPVVNYFPALLNFGTNATPW